jgi:hypothetical protein
MDGPLMGGRGSKGRPHARQPAAGPQPVDQRVRQAYQTLAEHAGDVVNLARLRDMLPEISREELDETLLTMDRNRDIQLEPDPHRIALTQRTKDAAIWLGGEYMHLICINPPPDTDTP